MRKELLLELPYPPSVNHYYRRVGNRIIISREGRRYRERVCAIMRSLGVKPIEGELEIFIELYPPDRRRRDLDNAQKAVWDSLQHGGAYHDDSQIKHCDAYMREPLPPEGKLIVRIQKK